MESEKDLFNLIDLNNDTSNDKSEDDLRCCICFESEGIDLVLLKCHRTHVVCYKCRPVITKCPLCRSEVDRCDIDVKILRRRVNILEEKYGNLLRAFDVERHRHNITKLKLKALTNTKIFDKEKEKTQTQQFVMF